MEVAQAKSERGWPENSLRQQQSKEWSGAKRSGAGRGMCAGVWGRSGRGQGRGEVPVARKVFDCGEVGGSEML